MDDAINEETAVKATEQCDVMLTDLDKLDELHERVKSVIDKKEDFLENGAKLLELAIESDRPNLIEIIYKTCMKYFKEDLNNNKAFLSIITSKMLLMNEYYPEYIERYLLDTSMIIDSPSYNIERNNKWHLYSFAKLSQESKFKLPKILEPKSIRTLKITFMVPYINFVDFRKVIIIGFWI